jgi:hypothetical protein
MAKMRRVQVLFVLDQYQKLTEIAQREGVSSSSLVMAAVRQWLAKYEQRESLRKRLEELAQIKAHWQAILDRRGGKPLEIDTAAVIEQLRQERDDELRY